MFKNLFIEYINIIEKNMLGIFYKNCLSFNYIWIVEIYSLLSEILFILKICNKRFVLDVY